jgi:hypothetical protein
MSPTRRDILVGGLSLVVATVLFAVVFGYLAVTFDYPAVLDRQASEVLPALLALGVTGRFVWLVYGLVPLLLIPTARGIRIAARTTAPALGRLTTRLAAMAAVSMMIGLLRWPTVHWMLAGQWMNGSAEARAMIADRFGAANLYLGKVIGEFAGELFLNGFFLTASLALAAGLPRRRWLAAAGATASTLGWIAMLRNITPVVSLAAALDNVVLPVWMLVLGVTIAVASRRPD